MHVSPITKTNYNSQNNTAFKARVPKNILNQMLGKTEPLKTLVYETKGIAYTLSATALASICAKNSTDKEIESAVENSNPRVKEFLPIDKIVQMSDEDFMKYATVQNEDGDTIFHFSSDDLLTKLEELDDNWDTTIKVFSIKNDDDKTALQANYSNAKQYLIERAATSGVLSLQDAVNFLEMNETDNSPVYVLKFLKAREVKEGATAEVSLELVEEIQDSEVQEVNWINVVVKDVIYPEVDLEVAARVFKNNETFPGETALDKNYIYNKATDEEIGALVDSALNSDSKYAISDLMNNSDRNFRQKVVDNLDLDIPDVSNFGKLTEYLDQNEAERLFSRQDKKDKWIIMHYSVNRMNKRDYTAMLETMANNITSEKFEEIMLQQNNNGNIPASMDEDAALATIEIYRDRDDLSLVSLAKIFTQSIDKDDNTIMHKYPNRKIADDLFEIMEDEPELLSDVLSAKNVYDATIYDIWVNEEGEDDAQFIKDKIIELATDSELSVKDSIELLEVNQLEPQVQEFLKAQLETEGKAEE